MIPTSNKEAVKYPKNGYGRCVLLSRSLRLLVSCFLTYERDPVHSYFPFPFSSLSLWPFALFYCFGIYPFVLSLRSLSLSALFCRKIVRASFPCLRSTFTLFTSCLHGYELAVCAQSSVMLPLQVFNVLPQTK